MTQYAYTLERLDRFYLFGEATERQVVATEGRGVYRTVTDHLGEAHAPGIVVERVHAEARREFSTAKAAKAWLS